MSKSQIPNPPDADISNRRRDSDSDNKTMCRDKSQINPNYQIPIIKRRKFSKLVIGHWILIGYWILVIGISSLSAQEITILYTGETHAMIYPCNCPVEPDGGVGRRATLIKELRKNSPNTLVLDSGGFFAGGAMDEHSQNTELDKSRTLVNVKAIKLIGYDALGVGDDEFNFGWQFLRDVAVGNQLPLVSCNINPVRNSISNGVKTSEILPYIIRDVAGIKVGIFGLTTLLATSKAQGLEFQPPSLALVETTKQLRQAGADIIVLLSHLGEDEDIKLIKDAQIDLVIAGHRRLKDEPYELIGSTLLLRPSWQARRLGKVDLELKDKKIVDFKVEELRVSSDVKDDPQILSFLPKCFSDKECKKDGVSGKCQMAGELGATCVYHKPNPVSLLIIQPRQCRLCDTKPVLDRLKEFFPGLRISQIYYPDNETKRLLRDLRVESLPAYLLGQEVEKDANFMRMRSNLIKEGKFYIIKPEFTGLSYFFKRKEKQGLDLFISFFDKDITRILETVRQFSPNIHFLAVESGDGFDAQRGQLEVEEYLRGVCVKIYYPDDFWNYLTCRSQNVQSSWWDDCLANNLDTQIIKTCAKGKEGRGLLKENISLNKELRIMLGPVYLVDNQEIFMLRGVPTKEEFEKIIKR